MANQEHLDILKQGVDNWNQWRREHPEIRPDLIGADLGKTNLSEANLSESDLYDARLYDATLTKANLRNAHLNGADLRFAYLNGTDLSGAYLSGAQVNEAHINEKANLNEANLRRADLEGADLSGSYLIGAYLEGANLDGALLIEADLSGANFFQARLNGAVLNKAILSSANLSLVDFRYASLVGANISNANLDGAILVNTDLTGAILTNCSIYGISAWNLQGSPKDQSNLVITPRDEPTITVDNLKIAQFIYLLCNNAEIRDAIDTIGRKAVLILGCFAPERKAVLDALREALRTHGYVPILFDFSRPASLDLTETVRLLAHLSRFIIADLTEPSSIPKELEAIVPMLAVPVQPLLQGATRPYAMFRDYWKYRWVLEVYRYDGLEELLAALKEHVIEPAERKAKECVQLRAQAFE